jgi:plastocyanin
MRFQEYEAPRLTLGVVGVIAILIPIALAAFLVTGMAQNYTLSSIGGGTTTTSTTNSTTLAVVQVSIPNGAGNPSTGAPGYAPDKVVVVIGINNTVNWTNNDVVAHTVTAVNETGGTPLFNSGNFPVGAQWNYTFTTPGTYPYLCAYHSWMVGTVIVKSGTPAISVVQVSIPNGAGNPSGAPGYAPDKITVVIGVNNTVNWTNNDVVAHTVTAVNETGGSPIFNSGNFPVGATWNYTFTTPGTYPYLCSYHQWMVGTVIVKAGSVSNTSSSTKVVAVSMPNGAGNPSGAPGYAPDKVTVVVGVNNTLTWTNNDVVAHTVTSNTIPSGATAFNSGNMPPGATFTFVFTVPGTYTYLCQYHEWMSGTVIVVGGSSSSSSSTSTSTSSSTTSSTASSSSSSSSATGASAAPVKVSMYNGAGNPTTGAPGYAPDNITIVIGVNNTVVWTNNDTVAHTVTTTSTPSGVAAINSGEMLPGATFTYTFTVPGVYKYICVYHSWMIGTVTVVQG